MSPLTRRPPRHERGSGVRASVCKCAPAVSAVRPPEQGRNSRAALPKNLEPDVMYVLPCRRRRRPAGTVVEAALVLSGLIFLLLGLVEYGRFVMVKHLVDNAARRSAAGGGSQHDRHQQLRLPDRDDHSKSGAKCTGRPTGRLSGLTIQVYAADANGNSLGAWTSATAGENIAVQIDATYTPMLPGLSMPFGKTSVGLLPAGGIGIHAKAMMQTESNS